MDAETITKASEILVKPGNTWSAEENKFIAVLVQQGYRNALKKLRDSLGE